MDLQFNAYTGKSVGPSALHPNYGKWVGQKIASFIPTAMGPAARPDLRKWEDPKVGWGLVLPEVAGLSPEQLARADDAPEAIRKLWAKRGSGPVLRYSPTLPKWAILRYQADGSDPRRSLVGSMRGTGPGQIPRYLLIYATPEQIPWDFQYALNAMSFVGRLDLRGEALENYVAAALQDWKGAGTRSERAVVWAVDHGGDITTLMRRAVADPIQSKLSADNQIKVSYFDGAESPATGKLLMEALTGSRPGLIVTTSHGMTGPLDDVSAMTAQLGLPVDSDGKPLDLNELVGNWEPGGAIWYAHACCSAGGDSKTAFKGLIAEDSDAARLLESVAACGARVSPLPRALLGAKNPLRAFIGHVEPTTDWVLRQKQTGQLLTTTISESFYDRLFQPEPIGLALSEGFQFGPLLYQQHIKALSFYNAGSGSLDDAITSRLMAVDRESMVILGDPVAALPPLQASHP